MKELLRENWSFILFQDEHNGLYLEVVCGTVGIYTLTLPLNEEERTNYMTRGESFIKELAMLVSSNPAKFVGRAESPEL